MGLVPLVRRTLTVSRADAPQRGGRLIGSTVGHSASLRAVGLGVRNVVPRPSMTDWMMARAVSLRGF